MPSTPEPSLEAPADPLPAPAASGDGAEAEPEEGSEPAEVTESIPAPEDFVRVADWIPDIYTDLRYAADNNFTGQAIYDFSDAYLRYGTVQKLAAGAGDRCGKRLFPADLGRLPPCFRAVPALGDLSGSRLCGKPGKGLFLSQPGEHRRCDAGHR